MEQWRDIKYYEGLYQCNREGEIKSLYTGKILKPSTDGKGYLFIHLYKNGQRKMYKIHRIVAETFIPNPDNLPCVNHKNENKTDNRVENLEWCTVKYNNNYGSAIQKRLDKVNKTVCQYTMDGVYIQEWVSASEIERQLGFFQGGISMCCRGKCKTAYGYKWKYKTPEC